MNSIDQVIASLRNSRSEIKATAASARASAPKGMKLPHGQHAQSLASAAIAATAIKDITAAGWHAASVTVNKAGTDIAVHFRAPVTLAQRLATWESAKAKRDAIRAAKRAAKAPVTEAKPSETAPSAASLLSQLDALLNRKAA